MDLVAFGIQSTETVVVQHRKIFKLSSSNNSHIPITCWWWRWWFCEWTWSRRRRQQQQPQLVFYPETRFLLLFRLQPVLDHHLHQPQLRYQQQTQTTAAPAALAPLQWSIQGSFCDWMNFKSLIRWLRRRRPLPHFNSRSLKQREKQMLSRRPQSNQSPNAFANLDHQTQTASRLETEAEAAEIADYFLQLHHQPQQSPPLPLQTPLLWTTKPPKWCSASPLALTRSTAVTSVRTPATPNCSSTPTWTPTLTTVVRTATTPAALRAGWSGTFATFTRRRRRKRGAATGPETQMTPVLKGQTEETEALFPETRVMTVTAVHVARILPETGSTVASSATTWPCRSTTTGSTRRRTSRRTRCSAVRGATLWPSLSTTSFTTCAITSAASPSSAPSATTAASTSRCSTRTWSPTLIFTSTAARTAPTPPSTATRWNCTWGSTATGRRRCSTLTALPIPIRWLTSMGRGEGRGRRRAHWRRWLPA